MLVAEQLFLLLRRDDGKAESALAFTDYALTGAVLTDLLLAAHITFGDDKDPRVSVATGGSTGNPVLDAALERVRSKEGKKLSSLVTDGRLDPTDRVAESLAAAGVIEIHPKKALGLVAARYPVLDPWPEHALRERLRAVLAGVTPDRSEASLLMLLKGVGLAGKVLAEEKGTLGRRELDRRIDEVSSEDIVGTAVRKAVEEMTAVITVVATTVAVGGSSG
jgi:hypothetical protein